MANFSKTNKRIAAYRAVKKLSTSLRISIPNNIKYPKGTTSDYIDYLKTLKKAKPYKPKFNVLIKLKEYGEEALEAVKNDKRVSTELLNDILEPAITSEEESDKVKQYIVGLNNELKKYNSTLAIGGVNSYAQLNQKVLDKVFDFKAMKRKPLKSKAEAYKLVNKLLRENNINQPLKKWVSKGSTKKYWNDALKRLIKSTTSKIDESLTKTNSFTSDSIINEYMMNTSDVFLKILTFKKRTETIKKKQESGFLPALCNKDIFQKDFKSLGVFSEFDNENYKINCVIRALKESKQCSDDELNKAKLCVKNRFITVDNMKKLSNMISKNIIINCQDDNCARKLRYGKFDTTIKLNRYKNHYFLDKKMNISAAAVKNFQHVKELTNWKNISKYNKANNKPIWKKTKNDKGEKIEVDQFINSMKLVKLLFNNGFMTPMTDEQLLKTNYHDMRNIEDLTLDKSYGSWRKHKIAKYDEKYDHIKSQEHSLLFNKLKMFDLIKSNGEYSLEYTKKTEELIEESKKDKKKSVKIPKKNDNLLYYKFIDGVIDKSIDVNSKSYREDRDKLLNKAIRCRRMKADGEVEIRGVDGKITIAKGEKINQIVYFADFESITNFTKENNEIDEINYKICEQNNVLEDIDEMILKNKSNEDIITENIKIVKYNKSPKHLIKKKLLNQKKANHIPFMLCYSRCELIDNKLVRINKGTIHGQECAKEFVDILKKDEHVSPIIYFHNLKYDASFIYDNAKSITNLVLSGPSLFSFKVSLKGKTLKFKCSYRVTNIPLRDFPKNFKITKKDGSPLSKEVMPYRLYTVDNIKKRFVNISEAIEILRNDETKSSDENESNIIQFIKNINEEECIHKDDDNKFDIIKYAEFYCERDVTVLEKGFSQFREDIIQTTKGGFNHYLNRREHVDLLNQHSVASIAHKSMLLKGVYDNTFEVSGTHREFIQKSVVGGRTMCSNNRVIKCKNEKAGNLTAIDMTSLYPSAMYKCNVVPQGISKVLKNHQLNFKFLNEVTTYFVKINIPKGAIRKKLDFPLLSKVVNGVRIFDNNLTGDFVRSKSQIEELIKHHKLDISKCKLIKGIYFTDDFNENIKKIIFDLFSIRKVLKEAGDSKQLVYKLIMNSSYGKTIQKEIQSTKKILNIKDANNFYIKNHYRVISMHTMSNSKRMIKMRNQINNHYSMPHVGSLILSESKVLMNRIFECANYVKAKIAYQDTDSAHGIKANDVEKIRNEYIKRYNEEMTGKQLGQVHIDIEVDKSHLKNTIGKKFKPTNLRISDAFYLQKKVYTEIIKYESSNPKDNKTYIFESSRMKGVAAKCITMHKSKLKPFEQFSKLYDNETIQYDLTPYCKFEYEQGIVKNRAKRFTRNIKIKALKRYEFIGDKIVEQMN